jgi:membrane protein YdbS with pleckstrin-like domain
MFSLWKFEDKRPEEKVVASYKRHPIVLVAGFFQALAVVIIVVIFFILFGFQIISVVSFIIGVIAIVLISLANLFIWYNDLYVLTDQRIIDVDQKGLFSRTVSETTLDQIQEVKVEIKGFMENVLGYGTVIVQTAGPTDNLILEVIAKPIKIQQIINNASYEYRRRIGVDNEKVEIKEPENIKDKHE